MMTAGDLPTSQGLGLRVTGLPCIALAALGLGTIERDANVAELIFGQLEPRLALPLLTSMPGEKCIRAAAQAVGLWLYRRNSPAATLEDLAWQGDPARACIWIALLRSRFDDPMGIAASYESPHYVLVLDVKGDDVAVCDPHLWREPTYSMPRVVFEAAWTAVRGPAKPRWAGCLSKRDR